MKKMLLLALVGTISIALFLAGCSSAEGGTTTNNNGVNKTVSWQTAVSKEDNEKIKKLISDYFFKMYSMPVDSYQQYSESGNIPEDLRSFIAKRTIEEGNNNTEIGLNFPRFVGMNGITLIDYTPLMKLEDSKQPQLEATYIEENNGILLYFVKMNLKAKCITDESFEKNYKLNEQANTYKKITAPMDSEKDTVLVQTKFDVELVKEENDYKILRARESTFKKKAKDRLFRYNNDFIARIPYLNLEKSADNTNYLYKQDGDTYDKEKAVIIDLFENLIKLDNERRILLNGSWEKGRADFSKLLSTLSVEKNKEKQDILVIDDNYQKRFPKEALLLQNNIYSIRVQGELKDTCSVALHPAYSEKNKWYIVTFKAFMNKSTKLGGNEKEYAFDYLVKLVENNAVPKIVSIKLNGIKTVNNPAGV